MHRDIESILYSEDTFKERIAQMGQQITADYQGADLVVVGLLKGAFVFMADLVRAIDLPLEVDFMVVSSYGSGTESSGELSIAKDLSTPVEGRDVLIIDDILDTGLTLSLLSEQLKARGAASVRSAVLLDKKARRKHPVDCSYVGFFCPDEFIVGYGLDYAQAYRALPYVGVLKPEVYENKA